MVPIKQQGICWSDSPCCQRSHINAFCLAFVEMEEEFRLALTLQLLIPTRVNELLGAEWPEFGLNFAQWKVKCGRGKSNPEKWNPYQTEFLGPVVQNNLKRLHQLTGTKGYLFPSLATEAPSLRDRKIAEAFRLAWPEYPIDSRGFPEFFRSMAYAHSVFRPEFVNSVVNHRNRKGLGFSHSETIHRRALAEWWAWELTGSLGV